MTRSATELVGTLVDTIWVVDVELPPQPTSVALTNKAAADRLIGAA